MKIKATDTDSMRSRPNLALLNPTQWSDKVIKKPANLAVCGLNPTRGKLEETSSIYRSPNIAASHEMER
jgi:hypothetical protein